ncbi:sensor histidine kinase [uncultured Methylobacterium sp.]|uniref:sensor histidine kinase n=1 Tax=uncultured Methylobacterium sp. TaxID=157278 RepID=UPI0035CAD7E5
MLTRRILALVALALAPALLIQGYNEYDLRTRRAEAARENALSSARAVAADFGQLAESLHQVLDLVAAEGAVRRKEPAACTDYLRDIIGRLPQLNLIAMAEPDGRIICDTRGSAPDAYSNAGRAYHQRVLATGRFAMGDYVVGVATGLPALHFAQPVRDAAGSLVGVVVVNVGLRQLSDRLQDVLRLSSTALTVTDRNGVVLVRRPDQATWVGRPLPPERLARLDLYGEGARSVEGLDGRARIIGVARPDGVLEGVQIVVGRDRIAAFADIDAATVRGVALILLGAVLALTGALLGGRAFIRRPVRRLLRTAAAWRAGDLDARTGLRDASEFGQLGQAFDAMASSLQGREGELRSEIARSHAMQEQQTTMLHELNHRVKNTLATVQSLARQSRGGEAQAVQLEARILALSKTHDLLTREDWTGASLREVLENELSPYRNGADHIALDGPDVALPPRYVLAIGMTVHELTTNAAKYGALSTAAGQVRVVWSLVRHEDGARHLRLDWHESGGPRVEVPERRGFGTRLIAGGIQRELGGEVQLSFDPGGLRCLLDVPLRSPGSVMLSPVAVARAH